MSCIPEMFKVLQGSRPAGKVPDGLKVSFGKDAGNNPTQSGPILAVGGFTLWPFSYYDNRVSLGMVMYDPKWNVTEMVEKTGTRYIYKMTIDANAKNVTFIGQSDAKVVMTFDEICALMLK